MGSPPLHLAAAGALLICGFLSAASLYADVSRPGSAPVNTDSRPRGRERERKEPDLVPAPSREDRIPVVEPKRIKVLRGETIQIPLETVEDPPSQRVRFTIREEPVAGTLGEPKSAGEDLSMAIATYSSDPTSAAKEDQFTFAAQYPAGRVSAPVPVTIEIVEPAPLISAVPAVDFGRTVLETESSRTIVLTNQGTASFSFEPALEAPWSWEPPPGERTLVLAAGESAPATFRFRPNALGRVVFRLPLPTGDADKPGVLFTGEGVVPFTLAVDKVELTFDPASRQRLGKFAITNPGPEGTPVLLTIPERLQSLAGNRVWLEKGQRRELSFVLPMTDPGAFQGRIQLESAGYQRVVEISAPPAPGYLEVSGIPPDHAMHFGEVHPGESVSAKIMLRNAGGQPLSVTLNPPKSPFVLSDVPLDAALSFPPGAEAELTLLLQPGQPQPVRDQLIISAPGQEFALLLQAEVMVPPSNVEVTAAANLSGGGLVGNGGAGSSGGADTMAGFAGGATSLPGAGSGTSAAPGPGGKDYRELFGRKPAGPAGLSTLVSSPLPSARGQNGEIALPPMVSLDGLIASSPYKLKTDVTLPTVPVFRVHHTTASRALLVWQRPKDFQANYEVEVRGLAFNPSTQQEECVWIPASNVKLTVADAYVTAEVRGLRADSYYIFRVFVVGPNGTNSLPSRESGARTMPATISLATLINLGFAVLALAGGAGFYFHFRREALG